MTHVLASSKCDAVGDRIWRDVEDCGFSFTDSADAHQRATRDPWTFAREVLNVRPYRIEVTQIKPRPGKGAYAWSSGHARLHSDMNGLEIPPHLQVLICARPAATGGEHVLVDSWNIVRRLRRKDPALFAALFERPRRFCSSNAVFYGATIMLRQQSLVSSLTATPPGPADPVGQGFQRWIDEASTIELAPRANSLLVVNNHRCFHGRTEFTDPRRELVRLLLWLEQPPRVPDDLYRVAARAARRWSAKLACEPRWMRERFGSSASTSVGLRRLHYVLRSLDLERGELRMLAEESGLSYAQLRYWQETFIAAGLHALDEVDPEAEDRQLQELLQRLAC